MVQTGLGLTCSLLPQWVKVSHENGVIHLSEEPLEDVCDILDEVVSDTQLHVSSVPAELVH